MLVVDASCLYEVVAGTAVSGLVWEHMSKFADFAAPHVIDVEVLGTIRSRHLLGFLDDTAATQAIDDLEEWTGERFSHVHLLGRAWQLRNNVRSWDAMYVALAELLTAPLLTLDSRLAAAPGIDCEVIVPGT